MEQNDITPVNGSWVQDSAYTLRRLELINKDLLIQVEENNKVIESINNNYSAITCNCNSGDCNGCNECNNQTINIHLTKTTIGKPEVLNVYVPTPKKCPTIPKVNVCVKNEVLTPPPIKRFVGNISSIQIKICGDLKNPRCLKCVEDWLINNKEFSENDLTQEKTGCKNLLLKERCEDLYVNIVDRASVKRYRECLERNRQKDCLRSTNKY
jgi:hypothetical protein